MSWKLNCQLGSVWIKWACGFILEFVSPHDLRIFDLHSSDKWFLAWENTAPAIKVLLLRLVRFYRTEDAVEVTRIFNGYLYRNRVLVAKLDRTYSISVCMLLWDITCYFLLLISNSAAWCVYAAVVDVPRWVLLLISPCCIFAKISARRTVATSSEKTRHTYSESGYSETMSAFRNDASLQIGHLSFTSPSYQYKCTSQVF